MPSMNHWVPLVLSSAVPFVLSGSSSSRATFRPFEIAEKRIFGDFCIYSGFGGLRVGIRGTPFTVVLVHRKK